MLNRSPLADSKILNPEQRRFYTAASPCLVSCYSWCRSHLEYEELFHAAACLLRLKFPQNLLFLTFLHPRRIIVVFFHAGKSSTQDYLFHVVSSHPRRIFSSLQDLLIHSGSSLPLYLAEMTKTDDFSRPLFGHLSNYKANYKLH